MPSFKAPIALLLAGVATSALAQSPPPQQPPRVQEFQQPGNKPKESDRKDKDAAKKAGEGRKVIQAALTAGNAKMQAKDYAGAITDYKAGVDGAPAGHPNLFELRQALSIAYRARGLKTYNDAIAPGVTALPAEVKTAAAADYRASLDEAAAAAAIAGNDPAKVDKLGIGMRETARLWVITDSASVSAAARPTLDLESQLFDKWAATAPPDQLTSFTPGLALALLPKDKEAALKYADAMFEKQPSDVNTVAAYGQIVAAANLAPTDPRRVKAKTVVVDVITNGTINDAQRATLRRARVRLEAAN